MVLALVIAVPLALHFHSKHAPVSQPAGNGDREPGLPHRTSPARSGNETKRPTGNPSRKLSKLAQPKLARSSSPRAANEKEKLLLLDSAIADTRANVAFNRFNTSLQSTLADLYREKQKTLEEVLSHDQKN